MRIKLTLTLCLANDDHFLEINAMIVVYERD